jgi:hypothetical protein
MTHCKFMLTALCSAFLAAGCSTLPTATGEIPHETPASAPVSQGLSTESLYKLARYYQGSAREAEAIATYQRLLREAPDHADGHNALGVLYALQGKFALAIEELSAAVRAAPGSAYLHGNLGYAYLLSGANEEALRELEEAQRLDPGSKRVAAHIALARSRLTEVVDLGTQHLAPQPPDLAEQPTVVALPPVIDFDYREPAPEDAVADGGGLKQAAALQGFAPAMRATAATWSSTPAPAHQSERVLRRASIEVANGNGTRGLARKVAGDLRQRGVVAMRISNHRRFNQPDTLIQYRPGCEKEAMQLRRQLNLEAPLLQTTALRRGVDVRLLLGRDFQPVAGGKIRLVSTRRP